MKRFIEKLAQKPIAFSKRKVIFAFFWGTLLHWGIIPPALIIISRRIDRHLPSLAIPTPYNYILAASAFLLGIFWTVGSIVDLWKIGKGTFNATSCPTRKLAVEGCYRYSRNPMYLGYLLLFAGVGLMFNSVGIIFGILPLITLFLIIYTHLLEEKALLLKFGEDYEEYRKKTPFLFPIPLIERLGRNIPSSIRFILSLILVLGLFFSVLILMVYQRSSEQTVEALPMIEARAEKEVKEVKEWEVTPCEEGGTESHYRSAAAPLEQSRLKM